MDDLFDLNATEEPASESGENTQSTEGTESAMPPEQPQMQEVGQALNCRTGGIAYTALVVSFFLISFAAALIVRIIAGSAVSQGKYADLNAALEAIQSKDIYLYISYLLSPLMITACVLFVLLQRKVHIKQIFPVKCKPKYYAIAVLLIFGLLFSLNWVNDVSVKFFKLFGYKPREAGSYFPDLSGGKVVLGLLVIAVMPAIFEETMFRGLLVNSCENGMGTVRTIFVTGFCFSLFHGSPEQTVYQFISGCAFAFIALRSGSILPSVIMHFLNNAVIVLFSACRVLDAEGALIMSDAVSITLTVLSAVSLVAAIVWLVLDKTQLKECKKGEVKEFFLYSSVAIGVLGLIWILSLFGVQ